MKHTWKIVSCAASVALPAFWLGMRSGQSLGQQAPALVNPVGADATTPPDAFTGPTVLGQPFEKLSEGISFRPPADCTLVQQASADFLAEWVDADRNWTLKIAKMKVEPGTPLVTADNFGKPIEGMLNQTVKKLQISLPGSKILRDDVTNTRDSLYVDAKRPETRDNVGLIAIRYTIGGQRRLSQQAIIRTVGGLYYLLTFTTPGGKIDEKDAPPDPGETLAADTFAQMIDSIRLLDRSGIKKEQDDRLYNSRMLVEIAWKEEKFRKLPLVSEQWVRIIKDGRDIGYSYITEDQAGGVPRPLTRQELDAGKRELDIARATPGDGILIGVRTRMNLDGTRSNKTRGPIQTDAASWLFVSADRKHEDFSRVVVTDDHIAPKKGYIQEFGVSDKRSRVYAEPVEPDKSNPDAIVIPRKNNEATLRFGEEWTLDVNQAGERMADPVQRKLPPFYLAQALGHLLPRLMPLNKPQGYMFATYVSEMREVMMRYVDVLPVQTVVFDGQTLHAIPIQDRLGLEGSVTIHYITVDGRYVGSENKDQKLMMIPTDDGTLKHIWADANLTRPNGIDRGTPANADAIGPRQSR